MNLCIYCQTNHATTRDHITLRGLFREPRPSNLITVPACNDCNKGFGPDDDYFLRLALDWGATECSDGKAVADSRLRSMRKQGPKIWKPFYDSVKPVEVFTPGGVFLANSLEFGLDTERLLRTVNRMIRGLYYHVTMTPLPLGDFVRSMSYLHFVEQQKDDKDRTQLTEWLASLPSQFIGDAFAFRYSILEASRHFSFWNLLFYRRIEFIGFTGDQRDPALTGAGTNVEGQLGSAS